MEYPMQGVDRYLVAEFQKEWRATPYFEKGEQMDLPDLGQLNITRTLGDAWYAYAKMRDAEQEKQIADGEYQKQLQHFDNNPKLREALETRKDKCDRVFQRAWSDYTKVAQEVESTLLRINNTFIEEAVQRVIKRELEKFPAFREMVRDNRRLQTPPGISSEDVESALNRAQEVMNDQYITLKDFRVQLDSVVEGIRVLTEHIEEYDKRLEGVQTSAQLVIGEVQAENDRRNKVICQALDTMHDKITNEVNSRLDIFPPSPASALTSPPRGSTRPAFAPSIPSNSNNAINTQITVINHAIKQLQNSLQTVQANHHRGLQATLAIPRQVENLVNDMHPRLHYHERICDEALGTMQAKFNNLWEWHEQHVQNSDNNFKETAIHMDSVKKRFTEHRRTLEDLIMAWKDSTSKLLELQAKFEDLKGFTGTKLVPIVVNLSRKSAPSTNDLNPASINFG